MYVLKKVQRYKEDPVDQYVKYLCRDGTLILDENLSEALTFDRVESILFLLRTTSAIGQEMAECSRLTIHRIATRKVPTEYDGGVVS